jgi:phosphohistidine phosphatase SixA
MPLSITTGTEIEKYAPDDTSFVSRLKNLPKGNTLVVGHSNTVDDLINGLTGKKYLTDLPDEAYGDLFVVKRKGKNYSFKKLHFGN